MSETSKRKRERFSTSACEDEHEEEQPPKRTKQECDGDISEGVTAVPEKPPTESPSQASSDINDHVVSDSRPAKAEHGDGSLLVQTQAQTQDTEVAGQCAVSHTGSAEPQDEPLHKLEDDDSVPRDQTDTGEKDSGEGIARAKPSTASDLLESDSQKSTIDQKHAGTIQCENNSVKSFQSEEEESELADLKNATSMPALDSVDMEAAQALTFLKQSASPMKSSNASSLTHKDEKSHPTIKSSTSVYTGSIRRKGFTKNSLAKHHLQKSVMKKLTPARSSADTDSDSQQESSSSVSPQRMVIDLQPTRKSARQAAQEDKVKPWSTMMKRGKKVKLEKRFPKREDGEEGQEETKKKRGRKKGSKGPSLDEAEVQLAKEACDVLEKSLEENAAKNNLSVVNVKNILHHVITNEHVLAMVRNTMEDDSTEDKPNSSDPSGSRPVVFEPKMTRAKLKEVSEKSGKVPFVWPVSPVKKPKPQFTDLNFSDSDDDDDDEYKPSQEDLLKEESDYESTASFGSPCPSTPRSSLNTSFLEDLEEEEMEEETEEPPSSPSETPMPSTSTSSPAKGTHIRAVAMPMGPPLPRSRNERLKEDAKFLKQLDELDQEIERSEDTIAHRTRSKFPIDKPLEEIEASFIAPDITEDMFDTWEDAFEDNEEWVRWLAGLYHGPKLDPEVSDTGEDDQNDPEYNFLAEEEAVDEEDFRNDKTVRISKKEVNELLDELIDAYENEDWAADFDMRLFDKPPQPTLSEMITAQRQAITPKEGPHKSKKIVQQQQQQPQQQLMLFTADERCQLQQQMQQHVQLLAQIHVLSRGKDSLEPHMNQAKLFLSELDMLAGRSEATFRGPFTGTGNQQLTYPTSAFRPCNLADALQITVQEVTVTEKELASINSNEKPILPKVKTKSNDKPSSSKVKASCVYSSPTEGAQRIIAHSSVFMFSELLPVCSLTDKPLEKTIFEKSEDILIVLGLMQYPACKDRQTQCRMICQNMLPIKTSQQVLVHVKNVCSKRHANVIKDWRKGGLKPTLTPTCTPVLPGSEKAPVDNFQLYDKRPEWLKKHMSAFYPKRLAPLTPAIQQEKPQNQESGRITPVSAPQVKETVSKVKQHTPSFSKLDPVSPSLGSEGQLRIRTLFPTKIAPKVSNSANAPKEVSQPSVLVITPQQGVISTMGGATVQIITSSAGGFTQVISQPSATHALTNPTADTKINPTSATNVNSPDCHSVTPTSTPDTSPKAASTSISPSGIAALQNFQPVKSECVSHIGKGDNQPGKERKGREGKSRQISSKAQVEKPASHAVDSKPSNLITKPTLIDEKSSTGNSTVKTTKDSENKNFADSDNSPPSVKKLTPSSTKSSPTPSIKSPSANEPATMKENSPVLEEEEDVNILKETSSPPSRSKSSTPDSLIDDEGAEEDNLEDAVASPGENILENADSNSQEVSDAEGLPITHLRAGDGITDATDIEKASILTTKMAAKRMKTKLRRDLESTVVLLDSDIVSKDPKREEREMSFSRAYLDKVKERFSADPERYVDFLGIFNSFSQAPEIPADEVYQKICQALEGHPDLIEDFTAFLPTDIALECGVLMENLEFAKARIFLRQVEVHFQKNPSQFQKVLSTIMEWGSNDDRTNNDLKESILPLLKGQPHLEQEFSLLFPDERPPDNYMMDFEEIIMDDDKDKEYDSFEEIEIPDSDEEIPITKSRVGRPPNKPVSSTQGSSGPRPSTLHRLLPKAALLKGRLPSILKSPARKKSASGSKSQPLDPWQELNTHLQCGTQGCNCSCHEKSHDTWVQRKVRHCAYCSARVTRKELISSLRGFTMGSKRRAHLLTGSQQPGTSEDSTQSLNPKRGSGRNPSGRKTQKVHWASTEDAEQDAEEEVEEEEEEGTYNDAVAHLSVMCDNLADYLNENPSEEDEEDGEDGKETDVDDDDVNEDDVNDDDEDDDVEDGQDDDEFEDLDDEDDQDDKEDDDDVDDDDDDDDGVDDAPVTSEESRGVEGATPESTVSPITSQGSHDSCQSGGSSESKPSPQPEVSAPSSQTTLLGSGVILEGNGSRANSPVTYDEDDQSTEDHMRQLKERLAEEKTEDGEGSNPPSVKNLMCEETLPDSPVRHFSTVGKHEKIDASVQETKPNKTDPKKTLLPEIVSTVPATQDSNRVGDTEKGQRSLPRKPAKTIRRVQTVRLTHSPKVPFGKSERVPLFESLAKLRSSPVQSPVASSSELAEGNLEENATGSIKVQYDGQAVKAVSVSVQKHDVPEKLADDATEAAKSSSQEGVSGDESSRSTKSPISKDLRSDSGKAGGTLLLSAANVDRKDGAVIVWTRDADRLLLQWCRDKGATQEVFEEVAETLGDKTSKQVGDRFATLMKLFQSASQSDDDESSEDDSENCEDEASGDEDKQESDAHDTDDKG
ncbi:GON-4-like protein isoform X2 [Patiria miniata]|nr:GON-4-like protein isoform X2 [Patiria miniata]